MKNQLLIFIILFGNIFLSNAQIKNMAGPRIGVTLISSGETTDFLTGVDNGPSAFTTQYGWQWESRFADGGNITGLAEWVFVVGGMERGKFLPSLSSLVGFRTLEGFEMGIGPNLGASGLGIVFGFGFTATSGKLNLPINFVFSPAREGWFGIDSGAAFTILLGFNISSE